MAGSGTSSGNYRRNALYNGKCSISHPQSRPWTGNLLCTAFDFSVFPFSLLNGSPFSEFRSTISGISFRILISVVRRLCSRSTSVMICGMLPWNGGTRNLWRISPPLLIVNFFSRPASPGTRLCVLITVFPFLGMLILGV